MKKALFLDIDGVLNHRYSPVVDGMFGIDDSIVPILGKIIQATGAEIILSSTWRLNSRSRVKVKRSLSKHGMDFDHYTSSLRGVHRSAEILHWLNNNPGYIKIAIIDDDHDAGTNGLHDDFFRTSWESGLTNPIAEKVIEHLGRI